MVKWRWVINAIVVVVLTVLTQIGGIAWLIALRWCCSFRFRLLAFVAAYSFLWVTAFATAPLFGRVPLQCFGETLRMQSATYCVLMRNYVAPELAEVAHDASQAVATQFPGTVTLMLDGGFPFLNGMPLLPHLSHDDGEKLDVAFYYESGGEYLAGKTRSPIGYWAFEAPQDHTCPPVWLTMRWGLSWLQTLWGSQKVEVERTRALLKVLVRDHRVGKVFVEPSLAKAWDLSDAKLRFQGCRAARHDDHIHFQL